MQALIAMLEKAERGETIHKAVWDILREHCGAAEKMPEEFVFHWPNCREYRFMGALGSGGKVWHDFRVSCYSESETPERKAMMAAANDALRVLRARAAGEG